MAEPLLVVEDLVTAFHTDEGSVRAVDGVSFDLADGQTLGIVGESGCGKSVTSLSIMRLVPSPPGVIERGSVRFVGRDLRALSEREMRKVRGNDISMIFQEPMTSLNPVHRVGKQVGESVRHHRGVSTKEAREPLSSYLLLPPKRRCFAALRAPVLEADSWPRANDSGMLSVMAAEHPNDLSPIPSAPFDDLDLDREEDEEEWERRVMELASARVEAARIRLERLGIINAEGKLVSTELPPDMMPDSDTTLETG